MILALILYPALAIPPAAQTYRGHDACLAAGRAAAARGRVRVWACVSITEKQP